MTLYDLARAAEEVARQQKLLVFPVPGRSLQDATDQPKRAYALFMSTPLAQIIAVPTGVSTMRVAISVDAAALR